MSETREEIIEELRQSLTPILREQGVTWYDYTLAIVNKLLSDPRVATIGDAELPENPYTAYTDPRITEGKYCFMYDELPTKTQMLEMNRHVIYKTAQQDMLKAGFKYKIVED